MKDLLGTYLAHAVITLCNFISGVLAARLLLPVGRGELGQAFLWPTLLGAIGACAITDSIIFHTANRRRASEEVLGSALMLGTLQSAVMIGIGLIVVPVAYRHATPAVSTAAYLYLLYIPLTYFAGYMAATFQGRLHFGLFNILRAAPVCGNALFLLILWALGEASVTGFVVASLLACAGTLAVGAPLLRHDGVRRIRFRFASMKAMLGYGLPIHMGGLLLLANQRLDQVLIVQWLPAVDYGYYLVALGLANSSLGLLEMMAHLAFPKAAAATDRAGQIEAIGRYMRLALVLALGGGALLFVLARWLVEIIFGASFLPAVPALHMLVIGIAPSACKTLMVQAAKVLGQLRLIAYAEGAALAANAALLTLLVRPFGILGAATALVAAQFLAYGVLALLLHRRSGLAIARMMVPSSADARVVVTFLRGMIR